MKPELEITAYPSKKCECLARQGLLGAAAGPGRKPDTAGLRWSKEVNKSVIKLHSDPKRSQ